MIEKNRILKSLDDEKAKTKQAFFKSLQPSLSKKTLVHVFWYYYLLIMVVMLQWYVFFYCVQYPSFTPIDKYSVNPVHDNAALIFFYLLCSSYLIIQAF